MENEIVTVFDMVYDDLTRQKEAKSLGTYQIIEHIKKDYCPGTDGVICDEIFIGRDMDTGVICLIEGRQVRQEMLSSGFAHFVYPLKRVYVKELPDYKKFYEYWRGLYGTGLQISGWHLNGELEDFDNFFDSAIEFMEGASPMATFRGKTVKELWEEFGDVPMNPETECIETSWCGFPAGTHREDIWHWFEKTFDVRVYDLMYS